MNQTTVSFLVRSRGNQAKVGPPEAGMQAWKVLVVDDEAEVHHVTRLVLSDITFDGRGLEMLHAHSSHQAIAAMVDNPDVAVAMIDVVMDGDDAGLRVIEYIRNTLKNKLVRIVLRTGQPGTAPEREVLLKYEINDYKTKSELSSTRLYSTVISALRGYKDLRDLETSYRSVDRFEEIVSALLKVRSLERLASVGLSKLGLLLDLEPEDEGLGDYSAVFVRKEHQHWTEVSRIGTLQLHSGELARTDEQSGAVLSEQGLSLRKLSLRTDEGDIYEIWLHTKRRLNAGEGRRADLYELCVQLALSRLCAVQRQRVALQMALQALLHQDDANVEFAGSDQIRGQLAQEMPWCAGAVEPGAEYLYCLAIESCRREGRTTAQAKARLRRISRLGHDLALEAGLEEVGAARLAFAVVTHDVGVALASCRPAASWYVPDASDRELASQHAANGAAFLAQFSPDSALLAMAARVARHHHETWNGTGFPDRLMMQRIPIEARLAAIVIFFNDMMEKADPDTEISSRIDEALDLIKTAAGHYFDPKLVLPTMSVVRRLAVEGGLYE